MDPWSSVRPFFPLVKPANAVEKEDQDRIMAYQVYENIYAIATGTFKLLQRGLEASPIYLPSPQKIVETTNRFLAVDWNYLVDPSMGEEETQRLAKSLLGRLFKRERMYSKFSMQKRYGLIRGDSVWHIFGDPKKAAGTRISIKEVDPSNFFPIVDDNDATRVIGVHLVDVIEDPTDDKKQVARRQTYRRADNGQIESSCLLFEVGKWDDRSKAALENIKQVGSVTPAFLLPKAITTIPVYHICNEPVPGMLFGKSQLAGIERVMAAVNQSITDEDLTLSMQGLGMYVTTSGPPKNEANVEGPWELGPGQVVELENGEDRFERVTGVGSVSPMLDHIKFMLDEMGSAKGVSDIAAGRVDVTVAESGISLALQLSPLLAANAEKEQEMLGVYDQMFYDILNMWLVAYEGFPAGSGVEIVTTVGDPMPVNLDAEVQRIIDMVTANLLSIEEARAKLVQLGYGDIITDTTSSGLIAEQEALALAKSSDPFSNRFSSEMENLDNPQSGQQPSVSSGGPSAPAPAIVA